MACLRHSLLNRFGNSAIDLSGPTNSRHHLVNLGQPRSSLPRSHCVAAAGGGNASKGRSLPPLVERHGDDSSFFPPMKQSGRSPVDHKDVIEEERREEQCVTEGQRKCRTNPLLPDAALSHTASASVAKVSSGYCLSFASSSLANLPLTTHPHALLCTQCRLEVWTAARQQPRLT